MRHFLIIRAVINARYDALIRDARLRRSPEADYWEREKEIFNERSGMNVSAVGSYLV